MNIIEVAAQAIRDKELDPKNDKPTRTDPGRRVTLAWRHAAQGKVEKIERRQAMRWKAK